MERSLPAIAIFFSFTAVAQVPVACYPFTSASPGDASGNGHHGSVSGATPITDRFGLPDQAYHFDGTDDRVELPALGDFIPGDEFSVSLWLKADASEPQAAIITQPDDAYDRLNVAPHYNHNGENSVFWDFGSIFSGGRVAQVPFTFSDSWQHWVFVHTEEGNSMSVYLDGELLVSENHHSTITDRTCPVWIGGGFTQGTADFFFKGAIDDVMFFDAPLSASTVSFIHADQQFAAPCSQVGMAASNGIGTPVLRPSITDDGLVILDWQGASQGGILEAIDIEGRVVRRFAFASGTQWTLDVALLAPGCYNLRCITDNGVFSGRMVKR